MYAILRTSIFTATAFIATILFSGIYQSHIPANGKNCYGSDCVEATFWIVFGINVTGSILALILLWLVERREKLRLQAQAQASAAALSVA